MRKSAHWRRDEPAFYNFLALERRSLEAPDLIDGLRGALMSRDTSSGSRTYVCEIPHGFRRGVDAKHASLELFVLRGDLALDGASVGVSGYLHLPQLCGGGEVTSTSGALVLAFWNPNLPCYPYPVTRNRLIQTDRIEWVNSVPGSHGVMHKSLRVPDAVPNPSGEGFDGGPGGYLRFQYIAPQAIAELEHVHHECWEEIIVLKGDIMLINEGQMGDGSVVSHPQEWYHAPFVSRSGAVLLTHTDGPMGYPWPGRPYPHGRHLCERYLAESAWDAPTAHVAWPDHPLAAGQASSSDYQSWRNSPEGARWGGQESGKEVPNHPAGRGATTRFRASWHRSADPAAEGTSTDSDSDS